MRTKLVTNPAALFTDYVMTVFIRGFLAFIFSILMSSAGFAQDADLSINDIAGTWRIEVIDRPDDAFKGSAMIPRVNDKAGGKSVMAETITEDKCCGGNHARVLQDSQITIVDGEIIVSSKIVKYLLQIERVEAVYSADDFVLTRQDANTLIGTANGYIPVRWVRDELLLS